ncbi:MAG: twin-arginine translocase TatA/TatE family subunit [Deltaproteobacteria bacterium]|nr:twin-arginine translocase TatA/TatE family subunit [Deltaproteobacteria bacterium]MCL5278104.1 twin-arginine translocase TatA/TatE family subunit [Deltaproteobacteria bacterium]
MFDIGMPELLVIFVIILVLFGGKKLPEVGKSLGEAIKNFKKAMSELDVTPADQTKKSLPENKPEDRKEEKK